MEHDAVICRTDEGASTICTSHVSHLAHDSSTRHFARAGSPALSRRNRRLLWGVGGTILSAVGFIAMILFEQYNSALTELHNDLKHFNETSSQFVKKESVQRYKEEMRECLKEMQASNSARTLLEQELRASEKAREEMSHELQGLRERLAFVEGLQTARPTAAAAKK